MTKYLTEKEVAALTGIPVQTLRNKRCRGGGFPFIKLTRTVRYREEDIHSYMASRLVKTEDCREME